MSGTQLTKGRKKFGMKIIKDQGKKSEMLEEKKMEVHHIHGRAKLVL